MQTLKQLKLFVTCNHRITDLYMCHQNFHLFTHQKVQIVPNSGHTIASCAAKWQRSSIFSMNISTSVTEKSSCVSNQNIENLILIYMIRLDNRLVFGHGNLILYHYGSAPPTTGKISYT